MLKLKKLEETLKEKEISIDQREQELLNKEKEFSNKEENLRKREEEMHKREKKLEEKERFTLKSIEKIEFKENCLKNNYMTTQDNSNLNNKFNSNLITNSNYSDIIDKASSHRKESISNINTNDQLLLGTPQNNYNSNVNKNSSLSRDTNYTINVEKSYKSSVNDTLNTSKISQKIKTIENDYNKLLSSPNYSNKNLNELVTPSTNNYSKYISYCSQKDSKENLLENININNNFNSSSVPLQTHQQNYSNYTNILQKNASFENNFSPKRKEEKSISSVGINSSIKCLNSNNSDFKFDPTIYTGKNNYNFNSNLATNRNASNNCMIINSTNNINLKVCKSQKNVNKSVTSFSTRNNTVSSSNIDKTPQKIQSNTKTRYSSIATLNNDKANSHNKTSGFNNTNNQYNKGNFNSYYKNY